MYDLYTFLCTICKSSELSTDFGDNPVKKSCRSMYALDGFEVFQGFVCTVCTRFYVRSEQVFYVRSVRITQGSKARAPFLCTERTGFYVRLGQVSMYGVNRFLCTEWTALITNRLSAKDIFELPFILLSFCPFHISFMDRRPTLKKQCPLRGFHSNR